MSPTKKSQGFTAEEKAAMKERAKELRASQKKADGEADVREKIAAMNKSDRAMAERIHKIVKATAPDLVPRTWYGMPAYAKDDKVIVFFKDAGKFKERYATLGFNEAANLDKGPMWPTSYALIELGAAEEKKITALVKQAAK